MRQPAVKSFKFTHADLGKFATKEAGLAVANFRQGCRVMGLTRGSFSLIDLIHATLQKTGPAHVVCTSWSAGIKDAHNVRWMMDSNLIQSFRLLVDHSYATRQQSYALSISELFGDECIRTGELHAKFVLIHNDEYKICIRTSMNLNANKTCESFELDENAEIFDFYMDFVENSFGTMPKGFTQESWRASASLERYFNNENPQPQQKNKWWKES